MSAPEVEFLHDQLQTSSFQTNFTPDLVLVDRDNAEDADGSPNHRNSDRLTEQVVVSVALVDEDPQPVGTEYDHKIERVANVHIKAAHVSEHGAVDPQAGTADATNVAWPTDDWTSVKSGVRGAITDARTFPQVGRVDTAYKDLFLTNVADPSHNYADYYRYTFDVAFRGFEDL